ncbi:ODF3A protein, partial [Quiscalus mexicanus]|nr:ODF3A protein [Quiscalus mexicanus]
VGTWRPDPRRGPILAECSTPGAKYWLPRLTGHRAHDPTKDRAPAHSLPGSNAPSAATCSPGPRYFLESSITKTGKQLAPSALVTAHPKSKSLVAPGPSDSTTDPASKHVFHTALANSLASRAKDLKGFRTPVPGTYSLPRILGPNTAYT